MKRRETLTLGNGTHTGAGESCEQAVTSLGGGQVARIMKFQGAGRPEKVTGILRPGARGRVGSEPREPSLQTCLGLVLSEQGQCRLELGRPLRERLPAYLSSTLRPYCLPLNRT